MSTVNPAETPALTDIDKAYLLAHMRHAAPDLYAAALRDLEKANACIAERMAARAAARAEVQP